MVVQEREVLVLVAHWVERAALQWEDGVVHKLELCGLVVKV